MTNVVYIGTSLDGYISSEEGSLDWLETAPNPDGDDLEFGEFIKRVDAVVMGRLTFETVVGFGLGWHYPKPGIVLSSTLRELPEPFAEKVSLTSGSPQEILAFAESKGYENLYIDGGTTIQRFLDADLIDQLIITEVPILLGGGDRLFGRLSKQLKFKLIETNTLPGHKKFRTSEPRLARCQVFASESIDKLYVCIVVPLLIGVIPLSIFDLVIVTTTTGSPFQ